MAKKKFRPRSGGHGGQGQYGGGYYGGGNGYGNGRPRRRRRGLGPGPGPVDRGLAEETIEGGEAQPRAFGEMPDGESLTQPPAPEMELTEGFGLLELHPNGYGFLRSPDNNYSRERSDPFVPGTMIEKYRLRQGVVIRGTVQPARKQQGPRLREILDVDGMPPDEYPNVKTFDTKTPINPDKWYRLETGPQPLTTRVMDLLTPLGRGQRALIVAPPRTGKTILLQHISHGIATNWPDVKLIMLLVDERPEEVTDMKRNVKGDVIASSLDQDIESHVRLSQLVVERCKRLAEMGKDVFLLMDSITRLARAFNKYVDQRGPVMSGGVNIKAMDIPKKLFATARAFEEGGSLTIVGTALIETGSRMDDLIFQEFKGTGNMELVLDRKLAERRVWPAIDVTQSGTRREELLLDADTLHAVTMLRRTLSSMHPVDAMEQLTKQLGRFKTNTEFIKLISSARMD
ncbi:MAG TPA: transcription termination factor Rho [Pirellulaceae bacterium]|nr:transcription termination factor Rho [Pirellulaceae bacterium]